jgi:hypothetical protein
VPVKILGKSFHACTKFSYKTSILKRMNTEIWLICPVQTRETVGVINHWFMKASRGETTKL